jgi:hypothetical protein
MPVRMENSGMDAEGARALARRIEEQKARDAALAKSARAEAAAFPAVDLTSPPRTSASAPDAEDDPETQAEVARRPRRAPPSGDIRMYSRDVQEVTIDGQPAVVTTVRCQALVNGEWRSRIVDVQVEPPRRAG